MVITSFSLIRKLVHENFSLSVLIEFKKWCVIGCLIYARTIKSPYFTCDLKFKADLKFNMNNTYFVLICTHVHLGVYKKSTETFEDCVQHSQYFTNICALIHYKKLSMTQILKDFLTTIISVSLFMTLTHL